MLTLTEAIKANRLGGFVDQEERRGIGPLIPKKMR
jgi:hypothetical protein